MPPCPGRRAALGLGVGALAALALGACGIRLEDDAPRVPLVPTRKPIAGESFLVALWRECGALADEAGALGGAPKALPSVLAGLHRDQSRVLREELRRLGVPDTVLRQATPTATGTSGATSSASGTTTGTGGPSGTSTAAPSDGPRGLAALEGAAVSGAAFRSLAGAVTPAVPLFGAVLAQRAGAATLLGGTVAWPDPTWQSPSLAMSFLESTRAAAYGFQVVAAQSPAGAQRTLAGSTLRALQARVISQESLAADAAGPPPLAYPLPFPVTTPAAARRLSVHLLTELRAAVARQLGSAGASDGPLGSLVQWLAETEVLASRWGVALQPFPGLVPPSQ